jgi:hypothetical protein
MYDHFMRTAVITTIDDRYRERLEKDFLTTLRGVAGYRGEVFLIYYGNDPLFEKEVALRFQVRVVSAFLRRGMHHNVERRSVMLHVLKDLSDDITHILCIDSNDVWFQGPIDTIFSMIADNVGCVEEDHCASNSFIFDATQAMRSAKWREKFIAMQSGKRAINAGMIVGERGKMQKFFEEEIDLYTQIGQGYYGLDQVVSNYVFHKYPKRIVLPRIWNYLLIRGKFRIRDGQVQGMQGENIVIVHNTGHSNINIFPHGREDVPSHSFDIPNIYLYRKMLLLNCMYYRLPKCIRKLLRLVARVFRLDVMAM